MTDLNIKTSLTATEKFAVAFAITFFGIFLSIVIGKNILLQLFLSSIVLFFMTGRRPVIIYASILKFRRDFKLVSHLVNVIARIKLWEYTGESVPSLFQKQVKIKGNSNMFVTDEKNLTYQEAENISNKVGRYFTELGYKKGDTVALMMENRPEYNPIWIGFSKIRVITALVNTNLRKESLIHSIKIVSSKAIIVSSELLHAIKDIKSHEDIKNLKIYVYDENGIVPLESECINLYKELENVSPESFELTKGSIHDKIVYIYTSGTTGLPKAVNITHFRYLFTVNGFKKIAAVTGSDIIYTCLPLYHMAGGVAACGFAVIYGNTVAIRKKFSASNFWTDCKKFNCTIAQYIGELCRYLLMTSPKPSDADHKIRLMYGNGLRPEIWKEFVERFNVKEIVEIYGATESNSNLANIDNKIGAVGFIPQGLSILSPVKLIKYDQETYEPLRNEFGFCMKCDYGESGILIGLINASNPYQRFCGYSDKKASEKKIIRNVFKKGDSYFNSGDILVMDVYGYVYFKDRVGDTYRWKGENVSTTEVQGAIVKATQLSDCIAYGVNLPGADGKAGMVTIVDTEHKIDIDNLTNEIIENLAAYARPVFIRITTNSDITSTFKIRKVDFQKEGYNITKITDTIYMMQRSGSYKKMTIEDYEMILDGRIRF